MPFNLPGVDSTSPFDINDEGVIVGNVAHGATSSGFVYQGGIVFQVDPPAAAGFTELTGVSNRGDAVGDYLDAVGVDRGFIRAADGTIADLPAPVPGFTFNLPSGINARGAIVGSYTTGPNLRSCVGYLLRRGKYQSIDIPGATCVFPNGINDRGDIIGSWLDANRFSHGFLLPAGENGDERADDARLIDLTIAGFTTVPWRMSEGHEIIGTYGVRVGRRISLHGFVRRHDTVRTLDDPAGSGTVLTGLTDGGVILGSSSNGGVLAMPIDHTDEERP